MDSPKSVIVGVFEDRLEAEEAVDELEQHRFLASDVGFVIRGSEVMAGGMITDTTATKDGRGMAAGAMTGGVAGGVLAAMVAMLIPGIGPVLAAGVFASFMGGAIAGTAVGGILGAMVGLGVSEKEAQFYEKEFNSGRAIVTVRAGNRTDEAKEILHRHGGYDIESRERSPVPTKGVFSQT